MRPDELCPACNGEGWDYTHNCECEHCEGFGEVSLHKYNEIVDALYQREVAHENYIVDKELKK